MTTHTAASRGPACLTVIAGLLLAGCATVGPDYQPAPGGVKRAIRERQRGSCTGYGAACASAGYLVARL